MNLPAPNLDDRTWSSLVEEAKRRIAAKCPGWTDFNPSDPGMALVDVMAWMTETVLYRLNRVPDLNYVRFLELIGVRLQPARPARAWIFFSVQPGTNEQALRVIPRGTRLSTKPEGDLPPLTFATCQALHPTSRQIIATGSMYAPSPAAEGRAVVEVSEVHRLTGNSTWENEIFHLGRDRQAGELATVPHRLYLGDSDLAVFGTQTDVKVFVQLAGSAADAIYLQWQAWDGQTWQNVTVDDETDHLQRSGEIRFRDLTALAKATRKQFFPGALPGEAPDAEPPPPACWLRANLIGSAMSGPLRLQRLTRSISSRGCIRPPSAAFYRAPIDSVPASGPGGAPLPPPTWTPVDTSASFTPFGPRPQQGSLFALSSELLKRAGDTILLQFRFEKPFPPKNAHKIAWEYRALNSQWTLLGRSDTSTGSREGGDFEDGTKAFTQDGTVSFRCPDQFDIEGWSGQAGPFIRARVTEYHGAGALVESPATPEFTPLVAKSLLLGVVGNFRPWQTVLAENYSQVKSLPAEGAFTPFEIQPEQDPAFYLCLDGPPDDARGPYSLFLDIVPHPLDVGASELVWARDGLGWNWQPASPALRSYAPQLVWEYVTTDDDDGTVIWQPLRIHQDGTSSLTRPGAVEFLSGADWAESRHFGTKGWWMRVRWQVAEYLRPPRLRRVALNAVEAEQAVGREWLLGSSDGSPNQSFSLEFAILDGPEVWVREDELSKSEIALLRGNAAQKRESKADLATEARIVKEDDGWWVRWEEVRDFHRSAVTGAVLVRHFRADLETGTIFFGDGAHGSIPPAGSRNISLVYRESAGARGNTGRNTITILEKSMPGISAVTNLFPAQGGCDREDLDHARARGPWEITHGDRAVTGQDFEALAQKASALVGKAFCRSVDGEIRVVIVPQDPDPAPRPSQRLVEQVTAYLDERRLINTRLRVESPAYQLIELKAQLVLRSTFEGEFSAVVSEAAQALRAFVHPLTGSDDGAGWEPGRALHKSELYYLLEQLPAVKYVDLLEIRRPGEQPEDRIAIQPYAFPCFLQQMEIERV
ncbi:MAG TPA: putative baseplate assembly protein [Chthoniobacter sp.]|nr:putative baseplate assembly protein [Chthoniobacter sp.]